MGKPDNTRFSVRRGRHHRYQGHRRVTPVGPFTDTDTQEGGQTPHLTAEFQRKSAQLKTTTVSDTVTAETAAAVAARTPIAPLRQQSNIWALVDASELNYDPSLLPQDPLQSASELVSRS